MIFLPNDPIMGNKEIHKHRIIAWKYISKRFDMIFKGGELDFFPKEPDTCLERSTFLKVLKVLSIASNLNRFFKKDLVEFLSPSDLAYVSKDILSWLISTYFGQSCNVLKREMLRKNFQKD